MNEKSEQKLRDLYARYQSGRTAMVNGERTVQTGDVQISETETYDHEERQVVSLYKKFQKNRVPDRERVIRNVMLLLESQSSLSSKQESKHTNTFWDSIVSFLNMGSMSSWQTAAVFSVVVTVTAIVAVVSLQVKNSVPNRLANSAIETPSILIKYQNETVRNIQPNLNLQFGLSSSYEEYQVVFRTGLLFVELPLLVTSDEQNILKQVILEASVISNQSKNSLLKASLQQLMVKLNESKNDKHKISIVDKFIDIAQDGYHSNPEKNLLVFGQWLGVSLLISQLDQGERLKLLVPLLQQGKVLAKKVDADIIGEPAVLTLIHQISALKLDSATSKNDIENLRKKLLQIKAAIL